MLHLSLLAFFALFPQSSHAVRFERACEPASEKLTLAAVGDLLLHGPLQAQAFSSRDSHGSLWKGVEDLIQKADLAYANLEGPAAQGVGKNGRNTKDPGLRFDNFVYSGYPLFNYHPILAWDLKSSGFDIVSTANNHSLDRGSLGVDRTIENLNSANLPYTGTRTRLEAQASTKPWHRVTEKNGWQIAWIACTFSTNGMPDRYKQVLDCFQDTAEIEAEIKQLAASSEIDAVIVTPHWGNQEYTHRVEPSQRALAKRFLEAGALGIFGNHPHVTKPWERYVTSDGRETFVIYSIGNFVSAQSSLAKKTSAIVYLGLSKSPGQRPWINGAVYVPVYMNSSPYTLVAVDRSRSAPREANKLLASLLGADRKVNLAEGIETNPECLGGR